MSLPGTAVQGRSFDDDFTTICNPRIKHDLSRSARMVDVIWDDDWKLSIEGATREKRGDGTRQRVTASAKVLKDWHAFLTHSKQTGTVHISEAEEADTRLVVHVLDALQYVYWSTLVILMSW